jgi:hypothetical protein
LSFLIAALYLGWAKPNAIAVSAEVVPSAELLRSARNGPWSEPATWENGKLPGAGSRVQIREGHTVVYDTQSAHAIRMIHIAGTLTFARDKDTRLDAGLIKIQAGDDASEEGFDCDAHLPAEPQYGPRPALEVGTPEQPIEANHTAQIRLVDFDGVDKKSWPAIVCCAGRMDFHGAPMSHTWVKLGATANVNDVIVTLAEPVTGWRDGDRVILTSTKLMRSGTYRKVARETEERIIKSIDGTKLTLDRPLEYEHYAVGEYGGEVANLSRNGRPPAGSRPYDVPSRFRRIDQLRRIPPPRQRKHSRSIQPSLSPGRRHDERKFGHWCVDLGQC